MKKIIVSFDDDMEPATALRLATEVVSQGKTSVANGIRQYCFASVTNEGTAIYTRHKRRDDSADSLIVTRKQQ